MMLPPKPALSVVVPIHNSEEWIRETLLSVMRQTTEMGPVEIVVVDDGSTDRGLEMARQVLGESPHSSRFISISRSGPSKARNVGWRGAHAPWVQFLDSDDLLEPGKFALQVSCASAYPEEVAVIYSEWQRLARVNETWQPLGPTVSPRIGTDAVLSLLETENFLQIGSLLIRREWLERVGGFDEELDLVEDVHLYLRIAMAGGAFVREPAGRPLMLYRQRESSLSRGRSLEFCVAQVRNGVLAEEYWGARGELTRARREFLVGLYEGPLRTFAEHSRDEFDQLLGRILRLDPNWLPRPRRLRYLTRLVGYRSAERISMTYRRFKRRLGY